MVTGFARRCCDWSSSPFPVGPFLAFGPVPRGAGLGFLSAGEVGGGASFGIFSRAHRVVKGSTVMSPVHHQLATATATRERMRRIRAAKRPTFASTSSGCPATSRVTTRRLFETDGT